MERLINRVIKDKIRIQNSTRTTSLSNVMDRNQLRHDPTIYQLALFVIFIAVTVIYFVRKFTKHREQPLSGVEAGPKDANHLKDGDEANDAIRNSSEKAVTLQTAGAIVKPPPNIDDLLRRTIIFGAIMGYYFLCDYIKIFPALERKYNRDEFLFLVFLLFLVGCAFTIRPTPDKILNRNQTEEWKGWMQVMFVWYHYFAAKEWYNWIRLYIACYVWMTGFGNFSFFWIRKDFSLWRMLKMLFRLNFLVIFVVMATDNQYMQYYICAMHTYWFLSVYVFMGVLSSWNEHRFKMALKFGAYFLCNALIFDIPGVAPVVFLPLKTILGYRETKYGIMHEWTFRVGLDHWVCFVGMLCAYNYPHFESFIKFLEEPVVSKREKYRKWALKTAMVLTASLVGVVWYVLFMGKEKIAYNQIHPYSSFIPIVIFIVLRNSFPLLRRYYIYMFEWLGKITLETYLSQLHVYLQSNAKNLIGYLPGYHLLNFALATIIYLWISHTLFNLTTEFSTYLIPKDKNILLRHFTIGAVVVVLALGLAFVVKYAQIL